MDDAKFKRQPGDEEITLIVVRRVVSMMVYLGFDSDGVVGTSDPLEDPSGKDETKIRFEELTFGFYFLDQIHLFVVEEEGEEPLAYGRRKMSNIGPTFFDPTCCTIGSAEEFFREHPEDKVLVSSIGTEKGQRMVRVCLKSGDDNKIKGRFYMSCDPEDRLVEFPDPVAADDGGGVGTAAWATTPVGLA